MQSKNFCREFYCSNIALFWLGGGGEGEAGFLNDYNSLLSAFYEPDFDKRVAFERLTRGQTNRL